MDKKDNKFIKNTIIFDTSDRYYPRYIDDDLLYEKYWISFRIKAIKFK